MFSLEHLPRLSDTQRAVLACTQKAVRLKHVGLKYLTGTEIAAGFFAKDVLPDDKAAKLQQVQARF